MSAPQSLRVLLVGFGSHGDVHPFVGIGQRLRERGHEPVVIANAHFGPMVEKAGVGFLPIGSEEDYLTVGADPDIWHPRRATNVVMGFALQFTAKLYELLVREYQREPHRTVAAASTLALGARVAQEKTGLPLATVHLSPSVFPSLYETPAYPGLHFPRWTPRWVKRLILHGIAYRLILDRMVGKPLNEWRATLGLPPVRGVLKEWWNSPLLTIGMWPAWFAAPQPDWPPQVRLTGFPLYDERGLAPLDEPLVRFLEAGDPPVAFTPGSAMFQGRWFFDAAAGACARLGRRGILLSRHAEHIPPNLPDGVIHVPFAPFSELLPRCAASVHHGGIGTTSQGLAAGVPQLIMPMAHDQFDTAARLRRMNVGRSISRHRFTAKRVARALDELLSSAVVKQTCAEVAGRFAGHDPLGATCDLIEGMAGDATAKEVRERGTVAALT